MRRDHRDARWALGSGGAARIETHTAAADDLRTSASGLAAFSDAGAVEKTALEIIDDLDDAVIAFDAEGVIRLWNRGAARMYGYQQVEALGMPVDRLARDAAPRASEVVAALRERGRPDTIEVERIAKNGERLSVSASYRPAFDTTGELVAVVATEHNLTGRPQLDDELLQAQRLEAIGRFSTSIAHDFNNLLMAIKGCANMAIRRLGAGSPAKHLVEQIEHAVAGGAALSAQLLNLGRKREFRPEAVDLDEVVSGMGIMFRHLLSPSVELRIDCAATRSRVGCGRAAIEQVLLNLVVNASDAMPEGGLLEISTLDATRAPRGGGGDAERAVVLRVRDTGGGIPDQVVDQVFEPFFTTKELGAGTGLGLATVRAIVEQCGGSIELESRVGVGTTFTIAFPLAGDAAPAEAPRPSAPRTGRLETVLVAEDAPLVRMSIEEWLRTGGYRVIATADGQAAITAFEAQRDQVALVIADVLLPGAGGDALARAVAGARPDLPLLFISAQPRTELVRTGRVPADAPLLQKPFSEGALLSAIADALGTRQRIADEVPRTTRTILLVDDDHDVRVMMREFLESRGYGVISAACGAQAITACTRRGITIDLLMTDMSLPGMTGDRVAEEVRARYPRAAVLFVTGRRGDDVGLARALAQPGVSLLEKPFELEALSREVARLLDGAARR